MEKYKEILQKYWGFDSFRGVQAQIIDSIDQGRDTLGIMPTGGGKSLTFQVPALNKEGVCLVISPLIALMNDQVEKLRKIDIKAYAIHSGMGFQEINIILDKAVYGACKILYVSPERLSTDVFIAKVQQMNVSFVTIDEAHCISQWGYDFRPSYLLISDLRKLLPEVPVLALTATATPEVVKDIQDKLQFSSHNAIQSGITRDNLVYYVRQSESKLADLSKVVRSIKGSGIVYLRSRRKTKEVAEQLRRDGIIADFYHAGLTYENRKLNQEKWSRGETRIIVATNAFGMGIDKADVRFVVHMDLPDSPEAYFQEAGRAGRDEKKAYAILLVNNYDKKIAAQRLATTFPEIAEIKRIYNLLCNFLQIPIGGGKGISYDFNLYDFAHSSKLNTLVTFSALKALEKEGYIELTDEVNNSSRILFLLSRDDLYKFQIKNRKFDGFIKLLLRSYTGLFSDYSKIDEEILSKRANISRDIVYQYLTALNKTKVISYIPARKSPLVIFEEERLEEKSLHISYKSYQERRERYERRINSMLEYALTSDDCRNNFLLKYFGQPPGKPCGNCDVCKSRLEDETSPERLEQIRDELLVLLEQNPQYLGELQDALEVKENTIDSLIRTLLDEEKVYYLEDGRLSVVNK